MAESLVNSSNYAFVEGTTKAEHNLLNSKHNALEADHEDLKAQVNGIAGSVGGPLVASTVSAMTDQTKIYVYTGTESGYTSGNWYYWNGSAWTSGGVYNSSALETDKTLSVEGMAADAKKTGDDIAAAIASGITSMLVLADGSSLNDVTGNTIVYLREDFTYSNTPDVTPLKGYLMSLIHYSISLVNPYSVHIQTLVTEDEQIFKRKYSNNVWSSWTDVTNTTLKNFGILPSQSLNDIPKDNCIYSLASSNEYTDAPEALGESGFAGVLIQIKWVSTTSKMQILAVRGGSIYTRIYGFVWEPWRGGIDASLSVERSAADAKAVGDRTRLVNYTFERGLSADTFLQNGVYFSSRFPDEYPDGTILDLPYPMGWLEVTRAGVTSKIVSQVFYPYSSTELPQTRMRRQDETWTGWKAFGGSTINNITNANTYEINESTYNVSATPTITSGLPYVLESTGDTTDRTLDIAAILTQYGSCQLGTGSFYVSNLDMPSYSSLKGSGTGRTALRLIASDETTDVYAVKMGNERCSISDLTLLGSDTPQVSGGRRYGLVWQGTYIDPDHTGTYPKRGNVSNVYISGFSGAGILCSNTSMSLTSGINVVNASIVSCTNGIEIKNYSEYHRFTNVEIDGCSVGVLNNGGNNMFVNCAFNGNDTGFRIQNILGSVPNDSHGSCVGCTFNHSGLGQWYNNGMAINLQGVNHGFVFDGCQIFYGWINISESYGVQFSNCNIGRQVPVHLQDNEGVILFNGNIFKVAPEVTKTNSANVKTANCYLVDGTEIII